MRRGGAQALLLTVFSTELSVEMECRVEHQCAVAQCAQTQHGEARRRIRLRHGLLLPQCPAAGGGRHRVFGATSPAARTSATLPSLWRPPHWRWPQPGVRSRPAPQTCEPPAG